MGFNIYTVWTDPVFYAFSAGFLTALFFLIYSIRRYVELKNGAGFEEAGEISAVEPPLEAAEAHETDSAPKEDGAGYPPQDPSALSGEPHLCAPGEDASKKRAEVFVKGIYEGLSALDARFMKIEAALSKTRVNSDFAVQFLEDILADLDSLDKEKIKARIEYLLSDLKK